MAKKATKQQQVYDVTPEQFVKVWEASETAEEAAEKLKMPKGIAAARASTYRQLGVKLKKMKRNYKRAIDVSGLNALIQRLSGGEDSETAAAAPPSPRPSLPINSVQETVAQTLRDIGTPVPVSAKRAR